jgi:hypothetical protein
MRKKSFSVVVVLSHECVTCQLQVTFALRFGFFFDVYAQGVLVVGCALSPPLPPPDELCHLSAPPQTPLTADTNTS